MTYYLYLIGGWTIYLFLHSLLATDWMKKKVNLAPGIYRLTYVIVSTVGLAAILYWIALSPQNFLFPPNDIVKYTGMILSAWGVIVIRASFRILSLRSFLGITSERESRLVITGIHAKVRHPIYSGTILLMIGMTLAIPNWAVLASTICIFIYLPIGIALEDKKLIKVFGEEYLEYRKNVKAVVPGVL